MSENKLKRKRKCNYKNVGKRGKYCSLCPGIQGFLIFCNQREKEAIRESYSLLNQFADNLYGLEGAQQQQQQPQKSSNENQGGDQEEDQEEEEEDLESALEKEKSRLQNLCGGSSDGDGRKKETPPPPPPPRRFQVTDGSINNLIFIRCTREVKPVELVDNILQEIQKTGKQMTRNLLRLVPVEVVCKPYESNVETAIKELLNLRKDDIVQDHKKSTYSVIFKSRYNNNLTKDQVINTINPVITSEFGPDKFVVDYKNPDFVIVVEIIQKFCCMSILKDYFNKKKYNLIEFAKLHNIDNNSKEVKLMNSDEAQIKTIEMTQQSEEKN